MSFDVNVAGNKTPLPLRSLDRDSFSALACPAHVPSAARPGASPGAARSLPRSQTSAHDPTADPSPCGPCLSVCPPYSSPGQLPSPLNASAPSPMRDMWPEGRVQGRHPARISCVRTGRAGAVCAWGGLSYIMFCSHEDRILYVAAP